MWMRKRSGLWEYVAVYVDNLAFAMKNPTKFTKLLAEKYKYKLKGTGDIAFHLGCDLFCDDDGVLCMAPCKYIDKMIDGYSNIFG